MMHVFESDKKYATDLTSRCNHVPTVTVAKRTKCYVVMNNGAKHLIKKSTLNGSEYFMFGNKKVWAVNEWDF